MAQKHQLLATVLTYYRCDGVKRPWDWAPNRPSVHPRDDHDQQWNDNDRDKPMRSHKNLSQCQPVQHKSHTD